MRTTMLEETANTDDSIAQVWDDVRQTLLRYVERRAEEYGARSARGEHGVCPDGYRDGARTAYSEALDQLSATRSFEDVFLAGRRLKHRLREVQGLIEFAEQSAADQDIGLGEAMDPPRVAMLIRGIERHEGERDAYAHVVTCVQQIYTL